MKDIIITTQAELDALPSSFDEYTRIIIQSTTSRLVVRLARGNSSVEARENSSVVARGNSSVVAWGNSSVEAWENSSVVAWGNSSVVARGNSSVEAWENCVVRIFSSCLKKVALYGFAVAIVAATITVKIEKKSEYCHIQITKDLGWFERNAVEQTPTVTLYKKVSKDFKTQEGTENETLWPIGATVEHPSWNPKNAECGGGKFHACSRPYFCDEFRNKPGDRYIAVSIKLEDLYEWKENPDYPHKIAFRAGTVLYECDKHGKEIK
jgi:hypothetical protein